MENVEQQTNFSLNINRAPGCVLVRSAKRKIGNDFTFSPFIGKHIYSPSEHIHHVQWGTWRYVMILLVFLVVRCFGHELFP